MKNKWLLICIVLLALSKPLFSALDTKGTDFWVAIPTTIIHSDMYLYISSDIGTTGDISIQNPIFNQSFTVAANSITKIAIPTSAQLSNDDIIENKGTHITTNDEVSIYVLGVSFANNDGFTALPVNSSGTEYMVMTYVSKIPKFVIIATEDSTSVSFTATASITSKSAGVQYNIILNKGETYLYGDNSISVDRDLTGSIIISDKPINVIVFNDATKIPVSDLYANKVLEQIPPTITWGKEFLSMPFAARANGDTYRFLAKEDNTTIAINGSSVATINIGQFYEQILTVPSQITSNHAILAMQFANGNDFDTGLPYGDPSMMLLVPTQQFMNKYVVYTPDIGFPVNYLNIITSNLNKANISLDSTNIPVSQFTPIASSGYSGCRVQVNGGAHVLSSADNFGVYVYGFNVDDAYSFPGGYKLEPIGVFQLN